MTKANLRLAGGVINQQDFAARMRDEAQLDRDQSIRALKELKTQLSTPSGGVKGGILRLMNASDRRGNTGKQLIFERKNWLQGGRYFSREGRQRTADALRILFQNAGLSTRALDLHLRENSNKAGGKAFLNILDRAVEAIDQVRGSEFDIDKTAAAARGLTERLDKGNVHRADLDGLVYEFNTLNQRFDRYVNYLELPSQQGQERTITQARPVVAARAQIEAAKTKLSQLQNAASTSKTEAERVRVLIDQASTTVDLCRARFAARQPAGAIHRELTSLRSEIQEAVTRGLTTASMPEDQSLLRGLQTALLSEIDQLTTQIESQYREYKLDPASDWHRYSDDARAGVKTRLTELAQQFDALRAERRSVLLRMAEPGRSEADLAADRAALEALENARQPIVDAARTERDKLTSLCEQWQPGERWREMPWTIGRPTDAQQRTLDFKAGDIVAREKVYLRGASRHFGLPAGDPSDGAGLSRLAQLLADPSRLEEAIGYARANRVQLGGTEAIGVLAAQGLAADPARVAAFALAVVDVEADHWDRQLRVLLMGAFPPPAGSPFGTSSAEFRAAVRSLAAIDADAGLAVAEDTASVYGGLVAPPSWTGSPGPIERAVLTIRQQAEVRLEGLDARDAIVSLAGASYDLRGTRIQDSTVLLLLDPGFHPHGPRFRNITLDRWPGTTVAFSFSGRGLRPSQWDATLAAAGQWVTSLPPERGEMAAALVRQLVEFSDEIRNPRAVAATVATATLRYPEVARDPQVRDWIESQGGWDEMIDRSWDQGLGERLGEAVSIKRLTDGSMSDSELMATLFRVPQLLSDPPVFQAVLARESRDEMFAKLFLFLPESKRSFCLRLMAASATASQTEDLRRRLSWAESSPIPAPGSGGPEPTVEQVQAHLAVLEDVAARAPLLFGQAVHAGALPNLLCWRDRMSDDDPATPSLRARIDAIEQAALHAPRFDPQVQIYAQNDLLPALEQMGYGRTVEGKWVWDGGQHYLIPTRTPSEDGQVFLLIRADAYRAMGQNPGAVDWGQVHLITAGRPRGVGQSEGGPVVRQLGGAERASLMSAAAEDLYVMQAALLSGEAELPGKLFGHLGVPPSLQGLLARGIKGIGVDGGSQEALRRETDEQMAAEVAKWVTEDGQLTPEHLTALRAWATEQRVVTNDREFAMFLFNLSASVTRLGSESGLGTAGSSVGALRQYGHLLFRQCRDEIQNVLEARPELIQGKVAQDYLNKIDSTFQADSCSDLLSVPMMDLGANMHLASYLRTVPQRWMNPNRAEMLQEILAGNEGAQRAPDEQRVMSIEAPPVFPVDNDAIQAQEDANPAEWPSLTRVFGLFDQAMARAQQAEPDYPGFVIAARRGLSDYQAYVNAAGYAPSSQFSHLPLGQRAAAAQEQGLILGVGEWAQPQRVLRSDGAVAGDRHTPHSALVERANEMRGRLEIADGHVVNEALLSYLDLGETRQAYVDAVRALKLADALVPGLQNWEGPLPARLDEFREQRNALLTARAGAPMQTIREALPAVVDALRQVEQARAELSHRDQLMADAIEQRESQRAALSENNPRREVLAREIDALQAHRAALADSLKKLSGEALVAFETEVRQDLDFLGRLGLLPDPPEEDPVDEEAVAVIVERVEPQDAI